jgi:hypothetical protein
VLRYSIRFPIVVATLFLSFVVLLHYYFVSVVSSSFFSSHITHWS